MRILIKAVFFVASNMSANALAAPTIILCQGTMKAQIGLQVVDGDPFSFTFQLDPSRSTVFIESTGGTDEQGKTVNANFSENLVSYDHSVRSESGASRIRFKASINRLNGAIVHTEEWMAASGSEVVAKNTRKGVCGSSSSRRF
jgi:hypothetical protein